MPGGRPSKFTLEVKQSILASLRAGAYVSTACQAARITEATFYGWMKLAKEYEASGNADFRPFYEFFKSAAQAIAESEAEGIRAILKHGKKDWRAIAWWLSRRHRDRWGSDTENEVNQKQQPPVRPLVIRTMGPIRKI